MSKSSTETLEDFLKKRYMEKEGADNMDTAIRDCLTDILHIAEKHHIPFHRVKARIDDAWSVKVEEGGKSVW